MKDSGHKKSIAFIVAVVLATVTAVVLGAFSFVNFRTERTRALSELRMQQEILANNLAVSLELPVWNFDRAQIDKVIESGMQNRDVTAIVVHLADVTRTVHGRTRNDRWGAIPTQTEPAGDGLLMAARNIVANGDTLGGIKVFTTTRFTEAEIARDWRDWLSRTAALYAFLLLFLYLLLWRLVLHPVRELEHFATDVTAGKTLTAEHATFFGELESLRAALEKMIQLLNTRHLALRRMAAQIIQVQDDERRKIGRDLHDSTGQTLAALEINLGILSRAVAKTGDARQGELINQCIDLASKCSSEIRTTSYLLHPPLLDEVGLGSAMQWYADGFSKRSNIVVTVSAPEAAERFAPDVELALFRVVQEALTNVHRHSGSSTASIRFATNDQEILLEIGDQGSGIDADELKSFHEGGSNLGVGIAGMRERIQQLGGDLYIESNGAGSVVRARVPRDKARR